MLSQLKLEEKVLTPSRNVISVKDGSTGQYILTLDGPEDYLVRLGSKESKLWELINGEEASSLNDLINFLKRENLGAITIDCEVYAFQFVKRLLNYFLIENIPWLSEVMIPSTSTTLGEVDVRMQSLTDMSHDKDLSEPEHLGYKVKVSKSFAYGKKGTYCLKVQED